MITELNPILNRDFQPPQDGWFQVVPKGEFAHSKGIVQVVDDVAIDAIYNSFASAQSSPNFGGTLVDFDHFSYDSEKPSEAAGWITQLDKRPDGLWAKMRLTDTGEAALKNGRYRFASPVWLPSDVEKLDGNKIRPLRFDSVGLTNSPNMRGMQPLSNREGSHKQTGPDGSGEVSRGEEPKKRMSKLVAMAALLGLAVEASEDAIFASVEALKNRADKAQEDLTAITNRNTVVETERDALLKEQVERDLDRFASVIKPEAREMWGKKIFANRKDTVEILESLIVPPKPAPAGDKIENRESKPPVAEGDFKAFVNRRAEEKKISKASAAREIISEKPELHKEWLKNGGGTL